MTLKNFLVSGVLIIVLAGCNKPHNPNNITEIKRENFGEKEKQLIEKVKARTLSDGANYDYSAMYPVINELENNKFEVSFLYKDDMIIGGAPIAIISKNTNQIIEIKYTR